MWGRPVPQSDVADAGTESTYCPACSDRSCVNRGTAAMSSTQACPSLPIFVFSADDPRMRSTVAAIEKDLLRDGLVLRYDTRHGTDGLPGSAGAFLACTFWLADNYALTGRVKEAENLFERLLSLRNHLGLLSEEYDSAAASDRQLSTGVLASRINPDRVHDREYLLKG
jgi:GH15 family glucan-1,4-alpha-glucosidase